jgi:glycosyltransferase involved in cell wall biosynthesis
MAVAGVRIPIAIFISTFDAGGTERQMTELMRRLDPARFAVHAVCFHRTGPWLARVAGQVASVAEFPIDGFARPATWRQVLACARWCREERITILQSCDFYANVFGTAAALIAGVPVRIASRRDVNPGRSLPKTILQRLAYAGAHLVVANSKAAAARLAAERVRPSRIHLIPNGVELSARPPDRTDRPLRRIVTVANLRPEKAHEHLIAAVPAIAAVHPDLEVQIVGDGPRRGELEALATRLGVAGIVRFLGHREDVPALLNDADVYVLASRSEAFPNGVIEAMAAGLPVVACAVGGLLELVDEGRTGRLIPPDDPRAMAGAVLDVMSDATRARAMGAAARAFVEERFSFDRMAQAFEQLYLDQIAARAPIGGTSLAEV